MNRGGSRIFQRGVTFVQGDWLFIVWSTICVSWGACFSYFSYVLAQNGGWLVTCSTPSGSAPAWSGFSCQMGESSTFVEAFCKTYFYFTPLYGGCTSCTACVLIFFHSGNQVDFVWLLNLWHKLTVCQKCLNDVSHFSTYRVSTLLHEILATL